MTSTELIRTSERAELIERLRSALSGDPRIAASWLWGSFGRGEEDAWSDLDVRISVVDHAFDHDLCLELPTLLGECMFTVEAPQNAPPQGAYLMSAHDKPSGPHLIDWYLQPSTAATPPTVSIVLTTGNGSGPEPTREKEDFAWGPSPEQDRANHAHLFWAMVLIQAKGLARNPRSELGFLDFLQSLMSGAKEVKAEWNEGSSPLQGKIPAGVEGLLGLCHQMTEVAPNHSRPKDAVVRFLETVADHRRQAGWYSLLETSDHR